MDFGLTSGSIDYARRVFLIALYAWAGFVFLLPLGINSLLNGRFILGGVLLANMAFALVLMIYSRVTKRVGGASLFFSLQAGLLALFLVVHGGVQGSGVYFSFPLAVVMIMLGFSSLRFGVHLGLGFIALVMLGLYANLPGAFEYETTHKARIVMALSAVCVMALISEWMRSQSYAAITDTAEQLNVDASHDQLTGLLNRRGFESRSSSLDEKDFPAVMGIIDIDHFKQINDEHGHEGGDRALVFFSDYLKGSLKGRDLICRWGGEEFIVFFPHLSFESGRLILDQIREDVSARTLMLGDTVLSVSFSAGLVEIPDKQAFQSSLKLADRYLYEAKQGGRNRIVSGRMG